MPDIKCLQCGYDTFTTNTLKNEKGQMICPQCGEPYEKAIPPLKQQKRFKFNGKI